MIEKIGFFFFSNNSSPTFNFDYFERLIFNYCKQTNFYWCRLIKVLKIDRKEVFNPFWWWCHFPYYLSISARSVSVLSKSIYFSHTSVFLPLAEITTVFCLCGMLSHQFSRSEVKNLLELSRWINWWISDMWTSCDHMRADVKLRSSFYRMSHHFWVINPQCPTSNCKFSSFSCQDFWPKIQHLPPRTVNFSIYAFVNFHQIKSIAK